LVGSSIFTRGDETVARYILRRRLPESARLLARRRAELAP
jgi:hypothetical protein